MVFRLRDGTQGEGERGPGAHGSDLVVGRDSILAPRDGVSAVPQGVPGPVLPLLQDCRLWQGVIRARTPCGVSDLPTEKGEWLSWVASVEWPTVGS